jgi:hypothetical protein
MPSERRLKLETALAVVGPHLLIVNFVMPWLAERLPLLAVRETEPTVAPSLRSFRLTPVSGDLADPGLWTYLLLVGLCFGVWVYFRRAALREWGQEILDDSGLDA